MAPLFKRGPFIVSCEFELCAARYYQYLCEEDSVAKREGYFTSAVLSKVHISDFTYRLVLASKIKEPDTVELMAHEKLIPLQDARPLSYEPKSRSLLLEVSPEFDVVFKHLSCRDMFIVSDLRFLVRRIRDWYRLYNDKRRLPSQIYDVSEFHSPMFKDSPSAEQQEAITGVLNNPFTYVWGAPGTGKTRFVLSRAVISYYIANKKVLIAAPTNNAVDQTLRGILNVMDEVGIPRDLIMRIGSPSDDFRRDYPEICENKAVEARLSELSDALTSDRAEIARLVPLVELKQEQLTYEEHLNQKIDMYNSIRDSLSDLLQTISDYLVLCSQAELELATLNHRKTDCFSSLRTSEFDAQALSHKISSLKFHIKIRNFVLFRRFSQTKLIALRAQLSEASAKLGLAKETISSLTNHLVQLEKDISSVEASSEDHRQKISDNEQEFSNTASSILSSSSVKKLLVLVRSSGLSPSVEELNSSIDLLLSKAERNGLKKDFSDVKSLSLDKLCSSLKELEDRVAITVRARDALLETKHPKNCLIVAATVDMCASRLQPGADAVYIPDHVFLDEAAYCPLCKAAILTAYQCPVTLLGDHMQIPPICNMKDKTIAKDDISRRVALWAQSAIYLENAFAKSADEVINDYLNKADVDFSDGKMQKYSLLRSYRFGPRLAEVLAGEIYDPRFTGSSAYDTELFHKHTPKLESANKSRINKSECTAIIAYLKNHLTEDIVVIAPYNNQVNYISEEIKKTPELDVFLDSVMTIHKAQGREFDTVLFSVTDTSDAWSVNSSIQDAGALKIINTAISRAKKKLVIFSDENYWLKHPNQLICKLIQAADPLQ